MSNSRFDFEEQNREKLKIHLLYVSISSYDEDWNSILHAHTCAELFYVIKGGGMFQVEEQKLPITEDDMIIVNPNVEHTEMGVLKEGFQYVVLGIEGLDFLFSNSKDAAYHKVSCSKWREEFLFYINTMLKETSSKSPHSHLICSNLLEVLLIKLMRATDYQISMENRYTTKLECSKVKRYIEENFRENITTQTLSQIAHKNKYHVIRTFTKENNISPIAYLNVCRIKEGKYLLNNTNYGIAQIATMVGFSSHSYFAQRFKEIEGIPPNTYRKKK